MSKDATSGNGMDSKARAKSRPSFFSDKRGSTAMEFAMLAIPFALLVFAILESCISFAGQEVMANVTDDVARQLRTGQLQKTNVTEASVKQLICSRLEIMVAKNCPGLLVDLRESSERAKHGTLSGALHAPYPGIGESLAPGGMLREVAAATGRRVVLFCAFGERSAMAVSAAKSAGLAKAAHIEGGIDAWKKAGGPIVMG